MILNKLNTGVIATSLILLGLVAPAQVQGVEELLETLVTPQPFPNNALNVQVTGMVPLRPGKTYRVVGTGILTATTSFGQQLFDQAYFFEVRGTPPLPAPSPGSGLLDISVGPTSIGGIAPPDLPFPPFNPEHRYERVFTATPAVNGVLATRLQSITSPATTTFKVELFGERVSSCNGRLATIDAVPGFPTFGTPGNDVIVGTEEDDQLFGRDGEDIICGLGGNDLILGNKGSDRLFGGPGDDQILGGDDDSRDILHGDDGQDRLVGGPGGDVLDGGPDVDRMTGGPGADRMLVNGGGSFVINPDGTVPITLRPRGDTLRGGPDFDLADYRQLPRPVRVDLRRETQRRGEILSDIEGLIGTPGDDVLIGDDDRNVLAGLDGNDRLDGRGGPDQYIGGRGLDKCRFVIKEDDEDSECEDLETLASTIHDVLGDYDAEKLATELSFLTACERTAKSLEELSGTTPEGE